MDDRKISRAGCKGYQRARGRCREEQQQVQTVEAGRRLVIYPRKRSKREYKHVLNCNLVVFCTISPKGESKTKEGTLMLTACFIIHCLRTLSVAICKRLVYKVCIQEKQSKHKANTTSSSTAPSAQRQPKWTTSLLPIPPRKKDPRSPFSPPLS